MAANIRAVLARAGDNSVSGIHGLHELLSSVARKSLQGRDTELIVGLFRAAADPLP